MRRWIRLAWQTTYALLAIVGLAAIAVTIETRYFPPLLSAAFGLALAASWLLIFRILSALAERTKGHVLGVPVTKRCVSRSGAGRNHSARPESRVAVAFRTSGREMMEVPGRRRFVRFDPDSGDPIYKWELAGEA